MAFISNAAISAWSSVRPICRTFSSASSARLKSCGRTLTIFGSSESQRARTFQAFWLCVASAWWRISVRTLIRHHAEATQSKKAWKVLALWDSLLSKIVKVLPYDFQRALEAEKKVRQMGLTEDQAEMAAFEMNAKDASRLGGN